MYPDHLTVVPASVLAVLAMGAPVNGSIRADITIEQYRGRLQELVMSQSDIVARAEAEKRELTVEEKKQLDDSAAEFERLEGEIERRERLIAQTQRLIAPQPRQAAPEPIPGDDGEGEPSQAAPPPRNAAPALAAARQVVPRVAGNGGFRSFGDFAQAVRMSSRKEHPIVDARLQAAAATSITQGGGRPRRRLSGAARLLGRHHPSCPRRGRPDLALQSLDHGAQCDHGARR